MHESSVPSSSELGITLIEVLVSALLVSIVLAGTMTAFASAIHISGGDRQRSQADSLAQQDEDRLRGMSISQLSDLNQTRTVQVGGTTFTITSTGQWDSESTGTSSCGATGSADFIQTTSSVSWNGMAPNSDVAAESVITPPSGGGLVVQVVDSQGQPVSGMQVAGSGPTTLSAMTGADGCAIFGGLLGGTYNVGVAQSGYVDRDGNTTVPASQQPTTVIVGASATKTFYFDQAGQVTVTFDTKPYGSATAVASSADTVTLFNNNMTFPGFRWAGTANSYASSITAANLFPFPSDYTIYAGSCASNAPSAFGLGPDPSITIAPGSSNSVLLHLPPINLTVWSGTSSSPGSPVSKPHVILTDQSCGGSPPTAGGSPSIKRTPKTTTTGQLLDPGQPFGTFTVCADNGTRHRSATVVNDVLTGTTLNLYLSGASSGVCT